MQSHGIQIWLPTWQHWKSGSEHPYWILISFSTYTSWPAMFTHMFSRWCCSLNFSSLLIIISTLKETSTQLLNFLSPTSSLLTPCRGAPHQVIILLQPSSSYTSHSPPWAWTRSNFPPTSSLPARSSPPPHPSMPVRVPADLISHVVHDGDWGIPQGVIQAWLSSSFSVHCRIK